VRDGEITIPIEYREAKSFTIQTRQVVNELMPVWRQTKAEVLEKNGHDLLGTLENLEGAIERKTAQSEIDDLVSRASKLLQQDFGLTLKRAGVGSDVVAETALEVRSLLGQSLAAAQNNLWRKAEQLRLDAYINFDLEIESRTLPRDPALAIRAEKAFLDGQSGEPGVKAALDARLTGEALTAAYQRALDALEECSALVKVGLSSTAAVIGAIFIVAREGLEAVVILAALLAGLRGAENAGIRKRIGAGAWLALGVTAVIFVASRTLLQGLSHYGETLEAVISVVAVIVLLIVTNWVFHKYYWTGWNARLRTLSKAAQRQQQTRWEGLALVGVGFVTIFREGFETTLFMQSLILEAGMRPVLLGLAIGGLFIGVVGFAVFSIGAKLPYRRMLVITGVLVIFVLFTFMGSTVRLFQTVGWLSVHPVPGLELPAWMGVWLGLYPTWEGLLIPFGTFAYVGGMWLLVKLQAKRAQEREPLERTTPLAA
jgi:high-affinity iron transporter